MSLRTQLTALAFAALLAPTVASAHCQVPCGIFDDHARVHAMLEDVTTITKAMNQITDLAKKSDALSQNQLTRWVMTKEQHAAHIIEVVSEYFLAQRVKADNKAYEAQLKALHKVMTGAMKTKQSVDPKTAESLRASVQALEKWWPAAKK